MSGFISGSENPQYPRMVSEVFLPDQLIAGRFPLVTAEEVTLAEGGPYQRGTVLGQATLPSATATAGGANVGNGTVGSISLAEFAPTGTYTLTATSATEFSVTAPNGDPLGVATAGQVFNNQIEFTITAGATAFAVNDSFTIATAQGSGTYKPCVKTASDGSQVPVAILADYTDATAGAVNAAIYLTGEFNANAITFDASWTQAAIGAALRTANIFLKNSVSAAAPTFTE